MKHLRTYNESLKDQMVGKSEQDLKNSLGEERYTEYMKLSEVHEMIEPFGYSKLLSDNDPMILKLQTELNDFQISFDYTYSLFVEIEYIGRFETKEELLKEIKKITLDSMDSYEKNRMDEINKLRKEVKDMKEEILQITKNL